MRPDRRNFNQPIATQPIVIGLLIACVAVLLGLVSLSAQAAPISVQAALSSDTPPGGISGRVTNESGSGLAGIEVSVSGPEYRMVTTDGNGEYLMSGLVPGWYGVRFSDPLGVYATEYYNDAVSSMNSQTVQITEVVVSGIDASLQIAGTIGGNVTDGTGPLAGVYVSAEIELNPSWWEHVASANTNLDGTYTLSGLRPGVYRVGFSYSNPNTMTSQQRYYDGKFTAQDATPITVIAGQTYEGIGATFGPPIGGISGRVTNESNTGLAGIEVSVSGPEYRMVTTDGNGEYLMSGLVPGWYGVRFSDPLGVYATEYYNDAVSSMNSQTVQITEVVVSGIDASLQIAGTIGGNVTDGTGPLAGVYVSAEIELNPSWWEHVASANTNLDGTYTLSGLRPGVYRVGFSYSNPNTMTSQQRYYDGKFTAQDATPITVIAGQTYDNINGSFAFAPVTQGAIRGRVRDALSLQRLPGIAVTAYDSTFMSMKSTTTDGLGEYEMRGLPEGSYFVGFSDAQNRYSPQYYLDATELANATAVQVTAGWSRSGIGANLLLQNAGGIAGTVTGSDTAGAGLPNIAVEVYRVSNGQWAGWTQTDSNGQFSLSGIEVGTYRVRFNDWSGPYVDSELNGIAVVANELADASIQLTRGRAIAGTVRNSSNQPVNDISVQAVRLDGGTEQETVGWGYTQSNGTYQISGLADGSYRLRFQDWSYRYLGTNVDVSIAGVDVTQDVALSQGGSISGQVTDTSGQALANAAVELYRESGEWAGYTSTNANGQFTIGGLSDGVYGLRISTPGGGYKPATRTGITVQNGDTASIGSVSLEEAAPPLAAVSAANANVTADPETGQVTIGQQNGGQRTDITIVKTVSCASGLPANVQLLVGAQFYAGTTVDDSTFTFVIPAGDINGLIAGGSADLTVQKECPDGTASEPVGRIVLYDPSGDITDEVTGDPVAGATVTLYKVPGWMPKAGPGDATPNTCQSHASKGINDPWDQPAPTNLGILPIAADISPTTNPQSTNSAGRYGWDVAEGCWYVIVEATSYETKVSPVVGVPPAVTDLDLALTPLAATTEEISLAADRTTVAAGETFQVFVRANSAAGLFGVSADLSFSTGIVEVTNVALGGALSADVVATNIYTNAQGILRFAYTQRGVGTPDLTGSGLLLATITFHAKTSGPASVGLTSALFTDRDGTAAIPTPLNNPLALIVDPSPSVIATVQLQGRSGQDLTGLISLGLFPQATGNVLSSNGSDAGGQLQITQVPSGSYRVRIDAAKYLAAEKIETVPNVASHNLTDPDPLILLGGDLNDDDRINIQDLVLIGVHFGSDQPADTSVADVNGDGRVNIQDLTITAGNFNRATDTAYGSW